jgi:hypothetical protein
MVPTSASMLQRHGVVSYQTYNFTPMLMASTILLPSACHYQRESSSLFYCSHCLQIVWQNITACRPGLNSQVLPLPMRLTFASPLTLKMSLHVSTAPPPLICCRLWPPSFLREGRHIFTTAGKIIHFCILVPQSFPQCSYNCYANYCVHSTFYSALLLNKLVNVLTLTCSPFCWGFRHFYSLHAHTTIQIMLLSICSNCFYKHFILPYMDKYVSLCLVTLN